MATKSESKAYSVTATVDGERNDCGVRALMVAACIDYATAHRHCQNAGRKYQGGMYHAQMDYAIRRAGFHASRQSQQGKRVAVVGDRIGNFILCQRQVIAYRYYYPTLGQFARTHPRGHFVVHVDGHYLAVCDGVVHDWEYMRGSRSKGARSRRGVQNFWQLV